MSFLFPYDVTSSLALSHGCFFACYLVIPEKHEEICDVYLFRASWMCSWALPQVARGDGNEIEAYNQRSAEKKTSTLW